MMGTIIELGKGIIVGTIILQASYQEDSRSTNWTSGKGQGLAYGVSPIF